jgi:hypothetical protein
MNKSFYTQRKNTFSDALKTITKQINIISNLRLVAAGGFLVVLYFSFSDSRLFYALPFILFGFIVLMLKHTKLFEAKTHLENLVKINTNELQAGEGDFSCFDGGSSFINTHHPYSYDLDVFGEGSLFQFMNRSSTLNGTAQLAHTLTNPLTSREAIIERQEAIKELSSKTDFRQDFLATGMALEEFPQDKQQLIAWVNQKPFLYGKSFYGFVLWFLPALTLTLVVVAIMVDGISPYAVLCAGLQWVFLGFHIKKVNTFHQYISRKKNILEKYARLLHRFGKESFTSTLLTNLSAKAMEADKKVKSLASLVSALDARLNSMTNLIVNSLLLYDLQCVYRLEKWKETNANNLLTWLEVINETDVVCTFATFSFNNPDFNFPSITDEKKILATSLGHPLLSAQQRVTNDVSIGDHQRILIITGANMAGKSTFLRTLGVNMVLALNGAPVCAKEFSCPILSLRSGMRTADSLHDNQSYFYAELDRLKTIMDELRSGKPLLILLDEILKGTNSTDKQTGSIALVKQLLAYSCLALIATHDLALGDLEREHPEHVKNYCFEPTIENDQLSFDYKLKTGLAQKMNATFLMRKMGIIPAN